MIGRQEFDPENETQNIQVVYDRMSAIIRTTQIPLLKAEAGLAAAALVREMRKWEENPPIIAKDNSEGTFAREKAAMFEITSGNDREAAAKAGQAYADWAKQHRKWREHAFRRSAARAAGPTG